MISVKRSRLQAKNSQIGQENQEFTGDWGDPGVFFAERLLRVNRDIMRGTDFRIASHAWK
jgi:hypothetical protein